MRSVDKRISVFTAATLIAFGVAMSVGCSPGQPIKTASLPGSVDQSDSALDRGVTVEAQRADFSGTSVDVELFVSNAESDLSPAGIRPSKASLEGVVAKSGLVGRDGTTVLRFPPSAWPDGAATLALTVTSVDFMDQDGEFNPVQGTWDLVIEAPDPAEAGDVREVEALDPVVVEIAGQDVMVTTFKTKAATIVRYALPQGVESDFAPKLKAGGTMLEPRNAEQGQRPGTTEVSYAPTGDEPLALVFDSLAEMVEDANTWSLTLALDEFDRPEPAGNNESTRAESGVPWEVVFRSDGPEVVDVLWRTLRDDRRLVVTFDGSWQPGPTPPVVLGDGEPMRVVGAGTTGDQSDIVVELGPTGLPPGELTIQSDYEVNPLPVTEVVLQP